MLVDRVLADLDVPLPEERMGNPLRGSRLGRCARQSAYMLWPDRFIPEPLPARTKLVFRFGDLIHDLVRSEFRRVIKGEWGMEEEKFYFPVPLNHAEAKAAMKLLEGGQLHGHLRREGSRDLPLGRGGGVILDESAQCLYVPIHPDGVADLSAYGERFSLATTEIKSMATGSFKRALEGHVDYTYRVQMACEIEAAGLDTHVFISVRKDTCHILEIVYSKHTDKVEIRFMKPSRMVEVLRLAGAELPGEADWEAAEVRHPFEPHLLEEARRRVRRILRAQPHDLPAREYGPEFTCRTCQGSGTQTFAKGKATPLKAGSKPCPDCGQTGKTDESVLPWQCSYCPFVAECWRGLYRLEITERPSYIIQRSHFEQAGIIVEPPEAS